MISMGLGVPTRELMEEMEEMVVEVEREAKERDEYFDVRSPWRLRAEVVIVLMCDIRSAAALLYHDNTTRGSLVVCSRRTISLKR
jgi:hypothetical protein